MCLSDSTISPLKRHWGRAGDSWCIIWCWGAAEGRPMEGPVSALATPSGPSASAVPPREKLGGGPCLGSCLGQNMFISMSASASSHPPHQKYRRLRCAHATWNATAHVLKEHWMHAPSLVLHSEHTRFLLAGSTAGSPSTPSILTPSRKVTEGIHHVQATWAHPPSRSTPSFTAPPGTGHSPHWILPSPVRRLPAAGRADSARRASQKSQSQSPGGRWVTP
mmetsp:Transcript_3113/g.7499  ORF Transcript_3113/g.7499 Transcript_3113/m.7499 type:complete len:221 (-) Transcript_3113:514-1176(-)